MSNFTPTAASLQPKGDRMICLYAEVDGAELFIGSALNGGGFEAIDKMGWVADALEAHYGIKVTRPGKPKPAKAAPKKVVKKKR